MMVANLAVDAVLGRGLAHVVEDAWAVGDRLRLGPRLEGIAEREHVRVGADAGIAEQVPGAADGVAAFEDDEILRRTFGLQVIAGGDAGQAGADDHHVEMFYRHCALRNWHAGGRRDLYTWPGPSHPASFGTYGVNLSTAKPRIRHGLALPRRGSRPDFCFRLHPRNEEGAGNAGCTPHPLPYAQTEKNARRPTQVRRNHSGIPCAMV